MRLCLTLLTSVAIGGLSQSVYAQNAVAQVNSAPAALGTPQPSSNVIPAQPVFRGTPPDPLVGDYSPAAKLGDVSGVRIGPAPTTESLSSPEERFNWGIPDPTPPSRSNSLATQSNFGGKIGEYWNSLNWNINVKSDHCFDDFISPMSNPFLAEDPRASTEIRPLMIYQTIPHGSVVNGGNLEFLGMRGSVAFSDRFSITLNKLGGIALNPGQGSDISGGTSLAEIWLGPKYTFFRNDQTRTIAAAGAIFQIPTGPDRTFQGTGDLSIAPYATVAQKFGQTSYGTFMVLDTLGWSLSVNNTRSDYLYNTIHLDYDVANWGKIYPLLELNWFCYTSNGHFTNLGIEGADIANIGSSVQGRNYLDLAVGSRFKVSETVTLGFMADFPLINPKDLFGFRLGVDVIWRY